MDLSTRDLMIQIMEFEAWLKYNVNFTPKIEKLSWEAQCKLALLTEEIKALGLN